MGEPGLIHNFKKSLIMSHEAEDLPLWEEVYQQAFPTMVTMTNHRKDGQHQRNGVDRSVILENAKQIWVDEKLRWTEYDDIALEYLSDEARNVPGWVCKPLLADYIAYAIAPLGKCYLLPVVQLQSAWQQHGEDWKARHFQVVAKNEFRGNTWNTVSVAVPAKEVFSAIGACLRIGFTQSDA